MSAEDTRNGSTGVYATRILVVVLVLGMLVAALALLLLRDQLVGEFEPVAQLYEVDATGRQLPIEAATLPEGEVLLALEIRLNRPGFVYVFRNDAQGEETLLFPLPGTAPQNPLKAGSYALPGDDPATWTVLDSGPGETVLVVASAGKLSLIENRLHALPAEGPGIPVVISEPTIAHRMREIGGLPLQAPADGAGHRPALRQAANKGVHLWELRRGS
ncbi:hypothetical protein ABI59_15400 [Acidobacteria bacterium Mor1]|nr:hypothetical protein ABI59_15400 [Acidobacteria bacterium Mor1]